MRSLKRLTLEHPPTGVGVLVTCRATSIAVGPHYPGYFRVEGPGVAASFEDNARPTTFTFVVPASGSGPVEIKVYTDPDRRGPTVTARVSLATVRDH